MNTPVNGNNTGDYRYEVVPTKFRRGIARTLVYTLDEAKKQKQLLESHLNIKFKIVEL